MAYSDEALGRAESFLETDLPPLAAELGDVNDPVVLDILRRTWKLGYFRAWVEMHARIIEAAESGQQT